MTNRTSTDPQVSALRDPLRPPATSTASSLIGATETVPVAATERARSQRSAADPRQALGLSARDLDALAFLGAMGVAAQYQLHIRCFAGRSEVVVSRCVQRLRRRKLVDVHRWNRTGINLLRLTTEGRQVVLENGGLPESKLFVPKWPAASALSHTLWIVDAVLALRAVAPGFDIVPCWALRRRFAGTESPVPDVLAVSQDGMKLIAVEVDMGGENLRRVFAPKLETLVAALRSWAPEASRAAVVLTTSERRAKAIEVLLGGGVTTRLLPRAIGRPAVAALAEVLTRP